MTFGPQDSGVKYVTGSSCGGRGGGLQSAHVLGLGQDMDIVDKGADHISNKYAQRIGQSIIRSLVVGQRGPCRAGSPALVP